MPLVSPSPDDGLIPEQFGELNRAFYATRPWDYFNHRNHLLMLAAGAGERLVEIAKEGVEYRGLKYQEESGEGSGEPLDPEAREQFLITDSEALLHHASETLLRLYLAHEELPPCPWLAMARVRNFGKFKKMVEKRFKSDGPWSDRRALLAPVFFGAKDRTAVEPTPSAEVWESGLENIEAFLAYYARHFLESDGYNAFKHGLAVRPGEQMTQLDDGALLKAEGPAIEFLSIRKNAEGVPRWNQSIRWVRPDHSMGMVFLAARLMESLWLIAKWRYVGEKPEAISLWERPAYADVTTRLDDGEKAAVFLETMHMELAYYVAGEDPG